MNYKLLTSVGMLLALGLFSTNLEAQTIKSAKVLFFDNEDMCFGGDFHAVSPNGKFAVGFSPEFTSNAYIWNRETNELTMLNEGATDDRAEAYSVSNDGVVAGDFYDSESLSEKGVPTMVPGYWKDGKWTKLPRVADIPNVGSGMNGSANAISADGKMICGYIYRKRGQYVQVLWKDGELQPISDEELLGQGNVALCFAQEGKVIGGFAEHEDGSRSPAVWADGKMTRLDGLVSATDIYEETGEDVGFFDGAVQCISEDGKYAVGYFDPSGDGFECKPFIWSKEDGIEYMADAGIASVITNDKTIYGTTSFMGSAFIYRDGIMKDLDEYLEDEYNFVPEDDYSPMSSPMSVSADGKVIVGWSLQAIEGVPTMRPMIIILEEKESSIELADADNLTIASSVITDKLQVNGKYTSAQIYDSMGAFVLDDVRKDGIVSFESLNRGVYFVKVSNGLNTQVFKVVKQ